MAGLLGFGAGKFLDRKSTKASKDSVKSKKSNIKTISKDVKIEKIGPLAAAVLGFGASKLLSSKASRGTVKPKRKNIKTISKK